MNELNDKNNTDDIYDKYLSFHHNLNNTLLFCGRCKRKTRTEDYKYTLSKNKNNKVIVSGYCSKCKSKRKFVLKIDSLLENEIEE